jgi:hypothetical protein
MSKPASYYYRPARRWRRPHWGLVIAVVAALAGGWYLWYVNTDAGTTPAAVAPGAKADSGRLVRVESTKSFLPDEVAGLARQKYGAAAAGITAGVTRVVYEFRSYDVDGTALTIYARAYIPSSPVGRLPVFAFGTGTTGIGDQCSPTLEQPQKVDWANYESHMMMYAGQGYVAVVPDYEGHRDPTRLHHYMVGELEGRAMLDSVRGLSRLPQAAGRLDRANLFLGGYSQGGHAAFWADKIQPTYAPELPAKGVVGFGPVMSVKDTLADVTHAANINWFGPYVLASYRDYYKQSFNAERILQTRRLTNLLKDATGHCIDTVLPFWGHTPTGVYTPEFIQAMAAGDYTGYPEFSDALDRNLTGDQPTGSAKLINQGQHDNVVLPRQQEAMLPVMCQHSRGSVQLKVYPTADHYTTMARSIQDTLTWMSNLRAGQPVTSNCAQ